MGPTPTRSPRSGAGSARPQVHTGSRPAGTAPWLRRLGRAPSPRAPVSRAGAARYNISVKTEILKLPWRKPLASTLTFDDGPPQALPDLFLFGCFVNKFTGTQHRICPYAQLDDGKLKVRPMVLPDKYFEAGSQNEQYEEAGLTAPFIEATMLKLTGRGSGQVQKAEKVDEEGTIA